jgi:hypothetical protein
MLFWKVLLLSILLNQTDAANLRSLQNVTITYNITYNSSTISAATTSSDACPPGLSVIFAQSVCRAIGGVTAVLMIFFALAVLYALAVGIMTVAGIIVYIHMGCVLLMGGELDPTDKIVHVDD